MASDPNPDPFPNNSGKRRYENKSVDPLLISDIDPDLELLESTPLLKDEKQMLEHIRPFKDEQQILAVCNLDGVVCDDCRLYPYYGPGSTYCCSVAKQYFRHWAESRDYLYGL